MESAVRRRLVRKTPAHVARAELPPPAQNCKQRGQVRVQGPSKYAAEVVGLVGKARRQKLNQCYEKNRKRRADYKRPGNRKKNKQCEEKDAACELPPPVLQNDSDAEKDAACEFPPPVLQSDSDAEKDAACEFPPPVLQDDSDAEFSYPSPSFLVVPQQQQQQHAEMEKIKEELAKVMSEKERIQRRLDWHENVRDWIASTGAAAAVHMAKYGYVPKWVRFEGAAVDM